MVYENNLLKARRFKALLLSGHKEGVISKMSGLTKSSNSRK